MPKIFVYIWLGPVSPYYEMILLIQWNKSLVYGVTHKHLERNIFSDFPKVFLLPKQTKTWHQDVVTKELW